MYLYGIKNKNIPTKQRKQSKKQCDDRERMVDGSYYACRCDRHVPIGARACCSQFGAPGVCICGLRNKPLESKRQRK